MENTKKRQRGFAVGLLTPILIAIFCFFGCEENATYLPSGYETIDGEYRVEITEAEDTCNPGEEFAEPWWDVLDVIVQEKYDDGTYLADIAISGEVYLMGVKVEPEGNVDYEYFDEWWGENYLLNGMLTSEEVNTTLEIQVLDYDGGVYCSVAYEISGYKLYLNAPPPEDVER